MKSLARPLALVVAGAALGWSGATLAQDERPARAVVTAAIEKAWPGAKVGEVEEEELALAGYEVEVEAGEQELEVSAGPDGTIFEVAREATKDELPAPVTERLAKLGGAVGDVARTERRAQLQVVALPAPVITWEVTLTRKGERAGRYEVELGADGAVLSEERVDDEEGDDAEGQKSEDEPSMGGTRR